MPIKYDRLFKLMESKKITIYRLRKDGIVGAATMEKMRKGEGHIDTRTIENLCNYLNCTPNDIMEIVDNTD